MQLNDPELGERVVTNYPRGTARDRKKIKHETDTKSSIAAPHNLTNLAKSPSSVLRHLI